MRSGHSRHDCAHIHIYMYACMHTYLNTLHCFGRRRHEWTPSVTWYLAKCQNASSAFKCVFV